MIRVLSIYQKSTQEFNFLTCIVNLSIKLTQIRFLQVDSTVADGVQIIIVCCFFLLLYICMCAACLNFLATFAAIQTSFAQVANTLRVPPQVGQVYLRFSQLLNFHTLIISAFIV